MGRHHRLFRYFADDKWAEEFLEGRFRFWSLGYFRSLEDPGVRGDVNEGLAQYRPTGGLQITNHTQGTTITMPAHQLTSAVRSEESLVYCMSRSLSRLLWDKFSTRVCVEIADVHAFITRVQKGLPTDAQFPGQPGRRRIGHRGDYYRVADAADTRWALPARIAISKLEEYRWQDEFRLVFSRTDALAHGNVALRLSSPNAPPTTRAQDHRYHDATVGSLRDLCRVHTAPPNHDGEGRP